eukprot:365400-Chlamydomonas_euryale.AAC.1
MDVPTLLRGMDRTSCKGPMDAVLHFSIPSPTTFACTSTGQAWRCGQRWGACQIWQLATGGGPPPVASATRGLSG